MEIKRFDEFVNESQEIDSDLSEQYDWWEEIKAAVIGPLYYAYKISPEKVKEKSKELGLGFLLGPLLATKPGAAAMKGLINVTPAGIIKNMSIAADKGDVTKFKTAWTTGMKYALGVPQIKALEKAVFADMKSFGTALKKMGY